MALSDLLVKMSKGQELSPAERDQLRWEAIALEQTNSLVKSWVDAGTQQPVFQPNIDLIYSRVFAEDTPELTVEIPSLYNHLLIFGSGRSTAVTAGTDYLLFRFNGDDGANYINQKQFAIGSGLTAQRDTGQNEGILGLLAEGGNPAGDVAAFFTVVPHYSNNTLNKNTASLMTPAFGGFYGIATNWNGVEPISSIYMFANAADIAAGSVISIYGVR